MPFPPGRRIDRTAHAVNFSHPLALAQVIESWLDGTLLTAHRRRPATGRGARGPGAPRRRVTVHPNVLAAARLVGLGARTGRSFRRRRNRAAPWASFGGERQEPLSLLDAAESASGRRHRASQGLLFASTKASMTAWPTLCFLAPPSCPPVLSSPLSVPARRSSVSSSRSGEISWSPCATLSRSGRRRAGRAAPRGREGGRRRTP
jgi:hypothetical protein